MGQDAARGQARGDGEWPREATGETTVKLKRPAGEAAALAALLSPLPPSPETPSGAHKIPSVRHETPHTVVLPLDGGKADRATLTVLRGSNVGATLTISRRETILGRVATADIRLSGESVSRKHARIVEEGPRTYFIEDLGSTNGTFVGGRPVKRAQLRDGDRLQLGLENTFTFALLDEGVERLQKHLYESSQSDALTGLTNRRRLFEILGSEIERARREGSDLGALMIDVDHFKKINDTFGHVAGDQVLRAIALTGATVLRAGDVFARYGGEEFAVLAPAAEADGVAALSERLRGEIARMRVEVGGGAVGVTVSIGAALLSECERPEGTDLIGRADARLYTAKAAGRNRVCFELA